jgi:acetyl-CoA carboxylase biotin carboxylase subunit
VEERFSMGEPEEFRKNYEEVAAILATLIAHRAAEHSAQFFQSNERDTSNWKWVGRWERMHR